jgi:acetylornithine deacetylase/succinyl-diaminopimelate desuccinylase-like protein
MGPGQLERSHKPDEFLLVDELDAGVRAYGATVDAYFGVSR